MNEHPFSGSNRSMITDAGVPRAADVLRRVSGLQTVVTCIDGKRLAATFEPDYVEIERRRDLGAGPLTGLAELHALWWVPEGWPTLIPSVPEPHRAHLLGLVKHVEVEDSRLIRRYVPAGRVRSLALVGRIGDSVIDRAIRCSPIFERYVVLGPRTTRPSDSAAGLAARSGIGVLEVDTDGHVVMRSTSAPAVVGVPSVYRWWVAELAFSAYTKAQDRS
jgi:hypothetical protein